MSTYTLRLRFTLASEALYHDGEVIELSISGHPMPIYLQSQPIGPIKDARAFTLISRGFPSAEVALIIGERIRSALRLTCTDLGTGLNASDHPSTLNFGKAILDRMKENGVELRGEPHGLTVYPDENNIQFMSVQATGVVSNPIEWFTQRFSKYCDANATINEQLMLAFELYGLSKFETSVRARFITLISCIESAAPILERSAESQLHVGELLKATENSFLHEAEKKQLLNALQNLKQESIAACCRAFVNKHGQSGDVEVWNECHRIRHKLLHAGKSDEQIDSWFIKLDKIIRRVLITSAIGKSVAVA
jgi:hypothetical protein